MKVEIITAGIATSIEFIKNGFTPSHWIPVQVEDQAAFHASNVISLGKETKLPARISSRDLSDVDTIINNGNKKYKTNIPKIEKRQILKAAKIDGASFLRIFFKIFLPLSLPIITVTVI